MSYAARFALTDNRMRVYIETTALEPENEDSLASWSSGLVLDLRRGKHIPILYGLVQREVQHSSQSARDLCECLQNETQISTIGREARQLAAAFQERDLLSQREAARRMHVALATVEAADALATRDEMLLSSEEMFAQAARELGYRPVPFRTPKMLASRKAWEAEAGSGKPFSPADKLVHYLLMGVISLWFVTSKPGREGRILNGVVVLLLLVFALLAIVGLLTVVRWFW